MIMIYWFLFSGYILFDFFLAISSDISHPIPCNAPDKTTDGLIFSDCSGPGPGDKRWFDLDLPNNIPLNVQVLDFSNWQHILVSNSTFRRYTNLKRVILQFNYFISTLQIEGRRSEWFEYLYNHLFADTTLEEITLFSCGIHDSEQFRFPASLKMLNLSDNHYHFLNLTSFTNGEKLDVSINHLEAISNITFPIKPPPYLIIDYNPLMSITVDDIAAACWLKTLDMRVHPVNPLRGNSIEGVCECERIHRWFEEIKLDGKLDPCYVPPRESYDCSGYTLDEARKIRQECLEPSVPSAPTSPKKRSNNMFMITGLAILVLIILTYIVYKMISRSTAKDSHGEGKQSEASSASLKEGDLGEEEISITEY